MTASPSTQAAATTTTPARVNDLTIWVLRPGVDTVANVKGKGSKALPTFHDHSGTCKAVQGFEGDTLPVAAAAKALKAEAAREAKNEARTQHFCIRCLIQRVTVEKPKATKTAKAPKVVAVTDTNTAADNPADKAAVATPAPAKTVKAARAPRARRTVTAKVAK